jgi:hypothetical protein
MIWIAAIDRLPPGTRQPLAEFHYAGRIQSQQEPMEMRRPAPLEFQHPDCREPPFPPNLLEKLLIIRLVFLRISRELRWIGSTGKDARRQGIPANRCDHAPETALGLRRKL